MTPAALEREARLLARHLLGRDCPDECASAYLRAHAIAGARGWQRPLDPSSGFALDHPWAIGPVDAAGALTGRAPVLRAKLLLMTAILETTPAFADAFLPSHASLARTVFQLGWNGIRAAVGAAVGLPLVLALGRTRA